MAGMRASDRTRPAASLAAAFLLLATAAAPCSARSIKLATWNLDWLTTRPLGDSALPDDVEPKQPADIAALARYAARLDADAIGIEEVDGPEVAARIFPPDRYRIEMTNDTVVQRVGLAVRRDFTVTRFPDVIALSTRGREDTHDLRRGLDVAIARDGISLRLLVVHLKTGCWDRPLTGRLSAVCQTLRHQVDVLKDWIAARRQENMPFALIGDFNRNLPEHDDFLASLDQTAPMSLATAGRISPCWGGEAFIDHIMTSGAASRWMDPSSLRVLVYRETDPDRKAHLSDHCPVSVRLDPAR